MEQLVQYFLTLGMDPVSAATMAAKLLGAQMREPMQPTGFEIGPAEVRPAPGMEVGPARARPTNPAANVGRTLQAFGVSEFDAADATERAGTAEAQIEPFKRYLRQKGLKVSEQQLNELARRFVNGDMSPDAQRIHEKQFMASQPGVMWDASAQGTQAKLDFYNQPTFKGNLE